MSTECKTDAEPLQPAEYDLAGRWLSDPDTNKWLASGWRGRKIDEKALAAVCMNRRNRLFLVRHEGVPCGLVALGCIDPKDKTALMWYLLGEQTWGGRGVMTSAVRQVARIAFSELQLSSLQASVMEPNHASARVLQKVGFKPAGRLRRGLVLDGHHVDRLLFDLLPEDLAL